MLISIFKALYKSLLIVCGVSITGIFILMIMPVSSENNYFPNSMLYINNSTPEIDKELNEINGIQYCMTSRLGSNDDPVSLEYVGDSLEEKIYYTDLEYNSKATSTTIKNNGKKIRDNTLYEPISLVLNFNCNLRNQIVYNEGDGKLKMIVTGEIPQEDNEILLSENYALKLIGEQGGKIGSYEQLVGTTIDVSGDNYIVSGIYAGGNDLYITPSQEEYNEIVKERPELIQSRLIQFNSKLQKEEFIDQYLSDVEYLDSREVNSVSLWEVIKYVFVITLAILSFKLMGKKNEEIIEMLNYHNYALVNYLYVYFYTIFTILIFLILELLIFF